MRSPVELVADADLDLGQAVEHVELGDAQARDAVDADRALQRAASSQPQRRGRPVTVPRSWPTRRQVVADGAGLVHRQLGRERPAADARRVGLGDAEDVVQQVRADAGAGRALPATQLLEVTYG